MPLARTPCIPRRAARDFLPTEGSGQIQSRRGRQINQALVRLRPVGCDSLPKNFPKAYRCSARVSVRVLPQAVVGGGSIESVLRCESRAMNWFVTLWIESPGSPLVMRESGAALSEKSTIVRRPHHIAGSTKYRDDSEHSCGRTGPNTMAEVVGFAR